MFLLKYLNNKKLLLFYINDDDDDLLIDVDEKVEIMRKHILSNTFLMEGIKILH